MRFVLKIVVSAFALWLTTLIVAGHIVVVSFGPARDDARRKREGIALAMVGMTRVVLRRTRQSRFDRHAHKAFFARRLHANQPCSVQCASVPASTKAQARWPERSSTT